jgi:hypothetical protein
MPEITPKPKSATKTLARQPTRRVGKTSIRRKTNPPRSVKGTKRGRPTRYSSDLVNLICQTVATGFSLRQTCHKLNLNETTVWRWLFELPEFRVMYTQARDIRADLAFGEQILDIADNAADDWHYNKKTGKLSVNKEAMLRSRVRIAARQFHMSRLQRETWGDKQQIDVKTDMTRLTPEERQRKADEVIEMLQALAAGPPKPPPLVYDPREAPDDEPEPGGGIGRRSAR